MVITLDVRNRSNLIGNLRKVPTTRHAPWRAERSWCSDDVLYFKTMDEAYEWVCQEYEEWCTPKMFLIRYADSGLGVHVGLYHGFAYVRDAWTHSIATGIFASEVARKLDAMEWF